MNVNTTMRTAFLNARIKDADIGKVLPIIEKAEVSLKCGAGIRRKQDWNAHLSFRTYNKLKTVGVMA